MLKYLLARMFVKKGKDEYVKDQTQEAIKHIMRKHPDAFRKLVEDTLAKNEE